MKYLTLTVVFEGSNLNYGEGFGNVLTLKKITSKEKNYSYISRQALRYDIVRMMDEDFGLKKADVNKEKGVIQFSNEAKIDQFPEIDFFGYMKTEKKKTEKKKGEAEEGEEAKVEEKTKIRKAVVRLSDAVSLEPFNNELDFGTNKGLADRIPNNNGNDIFQSEIHKSFYSYTITVELDKIGSDDNYKINISEDEKAKRVNTLLETIKLLYRDIRGKRENLSPVFAIGGIYDIGNPLFYNKVCLNFTKNKILINTNELNDVLKTTFNGNEIKKTTKIGFINGIFENIDQLDIQGKLSMNEFFEKIKQEVVSYYKG